MKSAWNDRKAGAVWGVLVWLIAIFPLIGQAATDPFVMVYSTDGTAQRDLVFETNHYKAKYSLDKGVMYEYYNLDSSYPTVNLVDTSANMGLFCIALMYADSYYYSVYNGSNATSWFKGSSKNYSEVRIKDIVLRTTTNGSLAPVKCDLRFYLWPDKIASELIFTPTSNFTCQEAQIVHTWTKSNFNWSFCRIGASVSEYQLPGTGGYGSSLSMTAIGCYDSTAGSTHGCVGLFTPLDSGTNYDFDLVAGYCGAYLLDNDSNFWIHQKVGYNMRYPNFPTWTSGSQYRLQSQIQCSGENKRNLVDRGADTENNPMSNVSMVDCSNYDQASYNGYNKVRSCYQFSQLPWNGGSIWSQYSVIPNWYEWMKVSFENDATTRTVRMQFRQDPVSELTLFNGRAILCDGSGFPTGISLSQMLRYDLDDATAYREDYGSFNLAPNQSQTFIQDLACQHWGLKPALGVGSQDLDQEGWGSKWFNFGNGMESVMSWDDTLTHSTSITDFCAVDGPHFDVDNNGVKDSWLSWIKNCGGHDLLVFLVGGTLYNLNRETLQKWPMLGPNMLQMKNERYCSSYTGVTGKYTLTMAPSTDVSRAFFHVRYDFGQAFTVDGSDVRKNLRLFTLDSPRYNGMIYNYMTYSNSSDTVTTYTIAHNGTWEVVGANLPAGRGFVSLYNSDTWGNCGFVVSNYTSKINGTTSNVPAVSLNTTLVSGLNENEAYLVPSQNATGVQSRDYAEFDVELIGFGSNSYLPIQGEYNAWAVSPPTLTMYQGTKVADWPPEVTVSNQVAEFTLSGGKNWVPVKINGFDNYTSGSLTTGFTLEEYTRGNWAGVHSTVSEGRANDFAQVDYNYVTGKYDATIAFYMSSGAARRFRVSQHSPQSGYTQQSDNDAIFVSSNYPPVWSIFHHCDRLISVTMKNVGTNTWTGTAQNKYGLKRLEFGDEAGYTYLYPGQYVYLDSNETVAPGSSKTFTFYSMAAPVSWTDPSFRFRRDENTYQMYKEGAGVFGQVFKQEARSHRQDYDWCVVSNDIPTTMSCGQNATFHITVRNCGLFTWVNHVLLPDQEIWFMSARFWNSTTPYSYYVTAGDTVPPFSGYTFTMPVTAPNTPGKYMCWWMISMTKPGFDFSADCPFIKTITVQ